MASIEPEQGQPERGPAPTLFEWRMALRSGLKEIRGWPIDEVTRDLREGAAKLSRQWNLINLRDAVRDFPGFGSEDLEWLMHDLLNLPPAPDDMWKHYRLLAVWDEFRAGRFCQAEDPVAYLNVAVWRQAGRLHNRDAADERLAMRQLPGCRSIGERGTCPRRARRLPSRRGGALPKTRQ